LITLQVNELSKHFGGPILFQALSFKAATGECLALTGANGSGKSTLLQILWGYLRPTSGTATLSIGNKELTRDERPQHCAFSAPYVGLPEYLSAQDILGFHFSKRAGHATVPQILEQTQLAPVATKALRHCSSGQRQRLRLALALYTKAQVLFLDEPCTNLDDAGIALYHTLLAQRLPSSLVIIASNWEVEMQAAQRRITIGP